LQHQVSPFLEGHNLYKVG